MKLLAMDCHLVVAHFKLRIALSCTFGHYKLCGVMHVTMRQLLEAFRFQRDYLHRRGNPFDFFVEAVGGVSPKSELCPSSNDIGHLTTDSEATYTSTMLSAS